jgi:hypothetical protein
MIPNVVQITVCAQSGIDQSGVSPTRKYSAIAPLSVSQVSDGKSGTNTSPHDTYQ